MSVTINGTTGVTTPDVTSDSYTGPISVSASAPDNSVQLNSSGNLGLGVTPSAWGATFKALEVGRAGSGFFSVGTDSLQISNNYYYNGTNYIYAASGYAERYHMVSGQHQWYTAPSGTAGNAISFTQAMTLDSSGNLLVGTTSRLTGEKLSVTSSGSGNNTCVFKFDSTDDRAIVVSLHAGSSGGTSRKHYVFLDGGGFERGSIGVNGSGTTYATSSDYRLKENIAPMTGALAKVAALKPVTYTWKANGSAGQGFIAHELQAVVPECVTGEKDATRVEQYEVTPAVFDDNGQVVTPAVMGERTVPVYQGIDTSFLVATLTAAIQEQQAIINAQAATITSMQADIAALKAKVGI